MPFTRSFALLVGNSLGPSLSRRLAMELGVEIPLIESTQTVPLDTILVAATSECSPGECAGLRLDGRDVVIIAAVPGTFQKAQYESAGARAYLPMAIDLGPLVETLRGLACA
jgi:hypothetical protein